MKLSIRSHYLLFIFTIFVYMACSQQARLSDLEFKPDTGYIYLDGNVFTGTAWSSDGKTISITCNNGVVVALTAYHANGAKAIVSKKILGKGTCYDETGKQITMDDIIKYYPQLIEQIAAMTYEIKGI